MKVLLNIEASTLQNLPTGIRAVLYLLMHAKSSQIVDLAGLDGLQLNGEIVDGNVHLKPEVEWITDGTYYVLLQEGERFKVEEMSTTRPGLSQPLVGEVNLEVGPVPGEDEGIYQNSEEKGFEVALLLIQQLKVKQFTATTLVGIL